ncbi:MAG: hypothetical protein IPH95_08280 [Candidatus Promineofilum sp.]|nr:hypothetical protein [Promineifilum sp.]
MKPAARLTGNILSALKLGDLDLSGHNLQWLEGMMSSHNLPPPCWCSFLQAYHSAAAHHLDAPAGEPIVNWLAKVVGREVRGPPRPSSMHHYWPRR